MTPDTRPVFSLHDLERAVEAEQIRLLYHQGVPAQFTGLLTVLISVVVFHRVVDGNLLALWFAAMLAISLARMYLNYRFFRYYRGDAEVVCWRRRFVNGTFASGVGWGTLALFFDPAWPVTHQIMLFIVYTGLIAGAFSTHAAVVSAFYAFFLPPVMMLLAVLLRQGAAFLELVLLFCIYIALMLVSSRRYSARLKDTFRTKFENKRLIKNLEHANDRLMELAEVDELTQLHNRRSMERSLKVEWERHLRRNFPLSLLYLDLDYFKQYNDTYGHHKGDEVLVAVAGVFKSFAQRATDLAIRFGGEEFAIILPDTPHDEALRLAEQVREAVAALNIEHRGSLTAERVTVSIGVATDVPSSSGTLDELKYEADGALYRAKEQGRNRVN